MRFIFFLSLHVCLSCAHAAPLCVCLPRFRAQVIMEATKLSQIASRRAEALFYSGGVDFYGAMPTNFFHSTQTLRGSDWAC